MVKLNLEGFISLEKYHTLELRTLYEKINSRTFHFTIDLNGLMVERLTGLNPGPGQPITTQEEALKALALQLEEGSSDPADQILTREALQKILDYY